MIIKLQLSIRTTHPKRRMLITCEGGRAFHPYEGDADAKILALMSGRDKAFFHAELVGGKVRIDGPAPWQDW